MVTGHRPNKLPDSKSGYDPNNPTRVWVRQQMRGIMFDVMQDGPESAFITGMALGIDQDFASVAFGIGAKLHAYIPGIWQCSKWPETAKRSYFQMLNKIKDQGGKIVMCSEEDYHPGLLLQRNQMMVDACDKAIAVWNGGTGGTTDAVIRLRKADKLGWLIIPTTREVLVF